MKTFLHLSLIVALCSLFAISAPAQKRARSRAAQPAKESSGPRTICEGEAVPSGYVIVSNEATGSCRNRHTLTIKKPVGSEIVCDGSPIPDGYKMVRQESKAACSGASLNPLTNALQIKKEGSAGTLSDLCQSNSVRLGMEAALVLVCVGQPTDIQTTLSANGKHEIWTYTVYDTVVLAKFEFQNDRLTAVHYRR